MADDDFVRLAENEGKAVGPWKMLASRIPAGVDESFQDKKSLPARLLRALGKDPTEYRRSGSAGDSDYQWGVYAWEQYDHFGYREHLLHKLGGRSIAEVKRQHPTAAGILKIIHDFKTIETSPLSPFNQVYLSGAGTADETGRPFGRHPYNYTDNASDGNGEKVRILAFSQGVSLSISQALVLADHHNLTPVTDNLLHQRLLSLKYRRAQANISLLNKGIVPVRTAEMFEHYSVVGRTVLIEALSAEFLERISLRDALDYRDANAVSLERFRTKVRSLTHDLADAKPGVDFEDRLIKIMDRSVVPELQTLADKLQESRWKMFGNLTGKLATTAIPASAATSLYAAFSGPALLALGVGAGATAFGLSVATTVERWLETRKLGQEWLAFTLGLRSIGKSSS